ncbi:unnamed protein product [marine sediment metagenome]|uniref:Uncharacterized protein n=1 Tax=marine sediment metagenome TaxID=412755 RepID=X1K7F7_9ZZZZ
MGGKSNKDLITEIHTVLLGVPGTEDNGVVGHLKQIETQLDNLNGAVNTNTAWRKALVWVIGSMIAGYAILNYIS